MVLAKWNHVKTIFCLKLSIFFLKIKMKHFQWEKKINRTCLNKGGGGLVCVGFFFCKEKNKENLLVGKINPFTDGLAVSLSAQAYAPLFPGPFPSLPAELVPQRMPPGSLPPSTAQEGSSPATLLTPVVTRVQIPLPTGHNAGKSRTFQSTHIPFSLSSPLEK